MSAVMQPRLLRRAMTVADLPAVVAVEATAYGHPWSRGNFTDALAAGYLAEVLHGPDAGLVGYFIAMAGVDELHLLNITVAPPWQGQGHGQALLGAVTQHARTLGLASLWLEVRAGNMRAQALYKRLGFAEVGRRRGYYPAAVRREDAVLMSLELQAPPAPPTAGGLRAMD